MQWSEKKTIFGVNICSIKPFGLKMHNYMIQGPNCNINIYTCKTEREIPKQNRGIPISAVRRRNQFLSLRYVKLLVHKHLVYLGESRGAIILP